MLHCLPQGMSSPPGYLRRGSPLREVCTVPRLNASRVHLACGVDLPFFGGLCSFLFGAHMARYAVCARGCDARSYLRHRELRGRGWPRFAH